MRFAKWGCVNTRGRNGWGDAYMYVKSVIWSTPPVVSPASAYKLYADETANTNSKHTKKNSSHLMLELYSPLIVLNKIFCFLRFWMLIVGICFICKRWSDLLNMYQPMNFKFIYWVRSRFSVEPSDIYTHWEYGILWESIFSPRISYTSTGNIFVRLEYRYWLDRNRQKPYGIQKFTIRSMIDL